VTSMRSEDTRLAAPRGRLRSPWVDRCASTRR
jgi:hypothetical protein